MECNANFLTNVKDNDTISWLLVLLEPTLGDLNPWNSVFELQVLILGSGDCKKI